MVDAHGDNVQPSVPDWEHEVIITEVAGRCTANRNAMDRARLAGIRVRQRNSSSTLLGARRKARLGATVNESGISGPRGANRPVFTPQRRPMQRD